MDSLRPSWTVPTQSHTPAAPCPRAGHSLAFYSDRIYLFGGYCDYRSYVASSPNSADQLLSGHSARTGIGVHFNSVHEYRLESGEWHVLHAGWSPDKSSGPDLSAPKPRRHASMVVYGGSLYVYAGFDIYDNVLGDLWEFRPSTASWYPVPFDSASLSLSSLFSSLPAARAEHTAVVHGQRMIVFGGFDGKKKLNDTYVFDFAQRQWSRPITADRNAPTRRCKHSAVVYKDKLYITGGFQYSDGDNFAQTDMHVLDLDTFLWSPVPIRSYPEALQCHKAVVCGDSMYIIGGKVRIKPASSIDTSRGATDDAYSIVRALQLPATPSSNEKGDFLGSLKKAATAAAAAVAGVGIGRIGNVTASVSGGVQRQISGEWNDPNQGNGTTDKAITVININVNVIEKDSQETSDRKPVPLQVNLPLPDSRGSSLSSTVFRYEFESNRWSTVETDGQAKHARRQLHACVAVAKGGEGSMSIFMFGGADRSKTELFSDLCELGGIPTTNEQSALS